LTVSGFNIPTVDLQAFADGSAPEGVAAAFGDALQTMGFVTIVNHGVPAVLMQDMYREAKAFFALPLEDKRRHTPPEQTKGRGYLPVGIESVAATLSAQTPPDVCEALVFASPHRERAGGPPNIWPTQPPQLSASVRRYFDAMFALCQQLMRLSALALKLPEDYFDAMYRDPSITLRFVNYPDQVLPPLPGQLRYGAHHDYGGLTILRQDDAPGGLQICDATGAWHDVPPHPDSLVINVGDLMSRWTNDRWRSTLHRVINPPRELTGSTQRLSMVAFTGPHGATEVACLPGCSDAANPPRHAPVKADAYVRSKLDKSMELRS
jgi:isopenicillin N synthase-like dioxygenase